MKNRQLLLIGFLCLINLTVPCFAKEWRNIFPLKTTRAEVIKLLGNPQKEWDFLGESFEVEDGIVRIRWVRPDCYGEKAFLNQLSVKLDSLAYQISFIPKEFLPQDIIKKEEPKEWETDSVNSKAEIPKGFKFTRYSIDCLMGGNKAFACSHTGNGFGYSNSDKGVSALYYYPTEKEEEAWKEKLQPCSDEQK